MSDYIIEFDYFYGNEAERFRFYMLPELLFKDLRFKKLSSDAKILYSFLLSQNSLSMSNGWQDEDGKTFIYYTQEEAMDNLNCANGKIVRIFAELDNIKLIERKKQGLGKPTKIYVKKFYSDYRYYQHQNADNPRKTEEYGGENAKYDVNENADNPRKTQTCENRMSGHSKIACLDVRKSEANYINNNYINNNYNKSINLSEKFENNSPESTSSETDRRTDLKNTDFSEILLYVGYNWEKYLSEKPIDENAFKDFEDSENIQKCVIPYHFRENKKAMTLALKFLFSFAYYTPTMELSSIRLLNTVISTITEIACTEISLIQKSRISYNEVIDKINEIIHTSSLIDWFFSFENEWTRILQERDNIKNHRAYLKSCIWNWMNDFEFTEDNSIRAIN